MKAKEVDWELLPPEDKQRRALLEPLFRWLSLIMDDFLRVPGTNFRIGLDPIIGLIPGLGDTASAVASAMALVYAARSGVPKVLLARMAANILINELIGVIPGIGDAFSFWFKSNKRNYELLQRYRLAPGRPRKGDWIFLILMLAVIFLVVCGGLIITFLILGALGHALAGR